jgi:hypothetical protein
MKKLLSFLIITIITFATISCFAPVSAQNVDGWFVKNLKLNAVGTHANVPNVNIAGAGIYGTDTTIYLPVASPNYNVGWWSVSCFATRVGTGTQSYLALKGTYDGTSSTTKAASSAFLTADSTLNFTRSISTSKVAPYKWVITNSGNVTMKGSNLPFPYLSLYILKGNDSTTVSCYYQIERKYSGR